MQCIFHFKCFKRNVQMDIYLRKQFVTNPPGLRVEQGIQSLLLTSWLLRMVIRWRNFLSFLQKNITPLISQNYESMHFFVKLCRKNINLCQINVWFPRMYINTQDQDESEANLTHIHLLRSFFLLEINTGHVPCVAVFVKDHALWKFQETANWLVRRR